MSVTMSRVSLSKIQSAKNPDNKYIYTYYGRKKHPPSNLKILNDTLDRMT